MIFGCRDSLGGSGSHRNKKKQNFTKKTGGKWSVKIVAKGVIYEEW